MKLKKLRITNFKSFKKTQVFDFGKNNGLYFMSGVNSCNSKLGSNAAGKSTVWDALCWVFYGATSRNLKAGNVCNWEVKKNCKVTVFYTDCFGDERVLTRGWGPQDLYFEEKGEIKNTVQSVIQETIRLNYYSFLNTVLIPQFGLSFFELSPSVREKLISEVLELDFWLKLSKKCGVLASGYDKEVRKQETKLSKALGELESLNLMDYTVDIENWSTDIDKEIKECEDNIRKLKNAKTVKENLLKELDIKYESSLEKMTEQEHIITECADSIKLIEDTKDDKREELIKRITELKALENSYKKLDDLRKGRCPVCNNKITREHILNERSRIETLINKTTISKRSLSRIVGRLDNKIKDIRMQRKLALHKTEKHRNEYFDFKRRKEVLESKLDNAEDNLEGFEKRLDFLNSSINPYIDKQKRLDEEKASLTFKKNRTIVNLQEVDEKYTIYKYWVKGFKELRLYLLKDSLDQLQFKVNEVMFQLGLGDWNVDISIDKINKKGEITGRGLEIYITTTTSPDKVLWENWSGGESQRLILAGTMGLSNLLKAKYGVYPDLEVWDEPANFMSEEGVSDLLELLNSRSIDSGLRVWLVDHSNLKYANFTGVVEVDKTESGSVIKKVS